MSAKKKSKAKSKKAAKIKEEATLLSRLPSFSLGTAGRWVNRSLFGALIIGGLAGVAFGLGPLKNRVGEIRADPLMLEFNWPKLSGGKTDGTWLNAAEQDRIRAVAHANLTTDPFDLESLERTQVALFETGWFKTAPTLQRKPGGVVDVHGAWRSPAAVARYSGWDHLVARDGSLLPVRYPIGAADSLPIILNTYTGPPRARDGGLGYGLSWPGGDIPAAIKLFDLLRTKSGRYGSVQSIDVSRYVSEGLLTIITTNGGRIVWGAAPGAGAPGEVTDSAKLERFENLFADPSWLGANRPPVEIHTSVVLIDESAGS